MGEGGSCPAVTPREGTGKKNRLAVNQCSPERQLLLPQRNVGVQTQCVGLGLQADQFGVSKWSRDVGVQPGAGPLGSWGAGRRVPRKPWAAL